MRHFFLAVLISLIAVSCTNVQHLAKADNTNKILDVETHLHEDEYILSIILPYKDKMSEKMGGVIGHTEKEIERSQPDGPMNRIVADIIHEVAEAHLKRSVCFAVQNYYGLRINSLPEGAITLGLVYELMPFENYLVILEISGETVSKFADLIASLGGWPVSHGIEFGIKEDRATEILINGEPLDLNATYTLATNDYLANGGDNAFFLRDYEQHNTGILIRDAMIEYISELTSRNQNISDGEPSQRIYIVD